MLLSEGQLRLDLTEWCFTSPQAALRGRRGGGGRGERTSAFAQGRSWVTDSPWGTCPFRAQQALTSHKPALSILKSVMEPTDMCSSVIFCFEAKHEMAVLYFRYKALNEQLKSFMVISSLYSSFAALNVTLITLKKTCLEKLLDRLAS